MSDIEDRIARLEALHISSNLHMERRISRDMLDFTKILEDDMIFSRKQQLVINSLKEFVKQLSKRVVSLEEKTKPKKKYHEYT